MKWQQIGNRKSASQNNICNRNKITAKKDIKLKQIYLRISLDLPSLNKVKIAGSQCLCGFPFSVLAKCLQFFKRNREKTFDKSYHFR